MNQNKTTKSPQGLLNKTIEGKYNERIMMPKRGVNWAFLKDQQQLNPKQEPNFTQQLARREYY
jgi:hypothetical protein